MKEEGEGSKGKENIVGETPNVNTTESLPHKEREREKERRVRRALL